MLSAQALAKSYGCDGTLAGVVAFAPEWPTRLNSFGFVDQLDNPTELTIQTGISANVVTVMRDVRVLHNRVGASHAGDAFPASARTGIDNAVTSLCQTPLGGYLQATAPHVGDIFDPTFSATMRVHRRCIRRTGRPDGGPAASTPGSSYYQFLTQQRPHGRPAGPPVLFVQGLADYHHAARERGRVQPRQARRATASSPRSASTRRRSTQTSSAATWTSPSPGSRRSSRASPSRRAPRPARSRPASRDCIIW